MEAGRDKWVKVVEDLVVELEELRTKIPDSVVDGSLEEALRELASALRAYDRELQDLRVHGFRVVLRPLAGLGTKAWLLANLAAALRIRITATRARSVIGIDYLADKLDGLLREVRVFLGYSPNLPLSLSKRR